MFETVRSLYDVLDYRNALGILESCCASEFEELCKAFQAIRINKDDLISGGGNESNIPKKFSALLRPLGWRETKISGDLLVKLESKQAQGKGVEVAEISISDFLSGHKIDYVKSRVAFDLEWNSKDQTFDRDLYAFGAFYQANIIDAAVIVTRSATLNPLFDSLGIKKKYGASTTWMGKLEYRVLANRSNGCPVLALGITPSIIVD